MALQIVRKAKRKGHTHNTRRNLQTLEYLLLGILILLLPVAGRWLLDFGYRTIWLTPTLLSVAVYGIGYLGFVQPESLSAGWQRGNRVTPLLDRRTANRSKKQLEQLMKEEKIYTDPELNMPALAGYLNITPHQLSYLLNEHLNKSFPEYINEWRVRECRRLLLQPEKSHFKIEEIGFMAGFNSKSTFNAAFKKVTGQTPSQYRKIRVEGRG